jgi:phenylalanyl-tRNA synthetase beta chain
VLRVSVPYWRSDIRLKEDLIEEVVRVVGLDKIPMTMPGQLINRQSPAPVVNLKRKVGDIMTGFGLQEIISYSLTGLETQQRLSASGQPPLEETMLLRLANPMSVEQEYLRPNLRASLLAALGSNRRYTDDGIWLFELGRIFIPRAGDLPDERETLCGILSGPLTERSWHGEGRRPDFFEVKGLIETLLGNLGVTGDFELSSDGTLDPIEQSFVNVDGNTVGLLGKVNKEVLRRFDIYDGAYLFEIDLMKLLPFITGEKVFRQIPRFPSVVRDIALVVDSSVTHRQIAGMMKGFPLVEKVAIFDVYQGEQVAGDKKSMAYRITYQSAEQTLTDGEVNAVQQQIMDKLTKELGAELRG